MQADIEIQSAAKLPNRHLPRLVGTGARSGLNRLLERNSASWASVSSAGTCYLGTALTVRSAASITHLFPSGGGGGLSMLPLANSEKLCGIRPLFCTKRRSKEVRVPSTSPTTPWRRLL